MVHTVDRGAKRDRLVWVSIVSSTDNQSARCSIQPPQQKHCVLHAKGETTRIAGCRYAMAQLMRMPACCYVEADYRMVLKRRMCESRAT